MAEAASAGKHIFCEKPIALELKRIDEALAAVEKAGVTLMVGFNRRYDAGNKRLRDAMMAGDIGTPEMCVINSRDPAPPPMDYVKVSGGIFLDMMIHDFDLARYLLNDEPEEIYAAATCLVDKKIGTLGDYDTAMATIKFQKGALCHIDNSRRAVYGYDQRAEIFGSKGKVFTHDIHNDNTEAAFVDGYRRPPIQNFFLERYMQAYQDEGKYFVECIKNGKKPLSGGYDGRMSVVMGYAALKSAKENRPVKISEIR
jgi:myo-inositol 2-dehydrogenase/D-chiro-inositol 1-dehydrogenase